MTWLRDNLLLSGVVVIAAVLLLALLTWAIRRKGRSRGTRTCRDCNGTGRIFTGVKAGNSQRGNFHVCRVCRGSGVVSA